MDCNESWEAINDYVDGGLEDTSAAAFDAHLVTCERCRSIVADLQAIRIASRALEQQIPPTHAWARLSRAIDAEPKSPVRGSWLLGGFFIWQPLASAAVLTLLVSGLSWIGGHLVPGGVPGEEPGAVATASIALDGSVDAELRLAEEEYVTAIASLEEITRSDATRLDDHTADMLRSGVEVIDEAIGESRAALENEPTNQLAHDSLLDALRSKVTLLQDTVALINETRQDGQAGISGISPELNQ